MPTVAPGSKILVSGANGYIAMWVIRKLLEQGYSVRGAVRSEAKGKHLKDYFSSHGDKVEWVIVEDITKPGAFDEAVKGVDGIEHMASPLNSNTDDPADYIVPAVEGTVGILKSALKEGGTIKRIVITSSLAAILSTVTNPPQTFSEDDWGTEFVETVKEKGKSSTGVEKYRASKTLAEQSAWELYKRHKSDISWDLVALNPPLVVGPTLQSVQSPEELNESLKAWFNYLFLDQPESALKNTFGYIHVEDIALAHVLAMQKENAGGERIMVTAGTVTWQQNRNLVMKLHPEYYASGILPAGNPEDPGEITIIHANEKGRKILGIEYKTLEKISEDTLAHFKAKGWLEKKYDPKSN